MEMSNQAATQCPGRKLGHQKNRNSSVTVPVATPTPKPGKGSSSVGPERIVVHDYTSASPYKNENMRGNFKLPGYEPTRLERLPSSPQTLFQKEQLLGMLEDFSKHMYDGLFQNGLSVPPSIELGLNSMGDINVFGNHPNQSQIGSLFANNSPLAQKFHEIAFTSRVQQLAQLQPGFRDEFFAYPSHSIQQISFVQIRAVELKPFRMTIDSAQATPDTAIDKPVPKGNPMPFHLLNTWLEDFPTLIPEKDKQDPIKLEEQKLAKEEVETHRANAREDEKDEKRGHVHKGKLRCIINS
ncbi:MAG: hypothetical protein HUJ29_10565 [Gammaproteobacteria bacterium]|nr:hypothetical protein [Gammaproteobacteria bacterium]